MKHELDRRNSNNHLRLISESLEDADMLLSMRQDIMDVMQDPEYMLKSVGYSESIDGEVRVDYIILPRE